MTAIQTTYDINPERGFLGDLARPTQPHASDSGQLYVPDDGRSPRPGDALYWDAARNRFALPTNAAQLQEVVGVLTYRKDTVQTKESILQFANDAEIEIAVFGTYWAKVRQGGVEHRGLRLGQGGRPGKPGGRRRRR